MGEGNVGGEQDSASAAADQRILVGLLSDQEIRLIGLTCLFDEDFAPQTRLHPISGALDELLANPEIRCVVVALSTWPQLKRILEVFHRSRPDLRLLVIGSGEDEMIMEALRVGAKAYVDLTAPLDIVRKALVVVNEGSVWAPRPLLSRLLDRLLAATENGMNDTSLRLTARECQVLELILAARSNREIAEQLGIEERTVKAHVGRLMRKTGAENRVGLSLRALDSASGFQPNLAVQQDRKGRPPEGKSSHNTPRSS